MLRRFERFSWEDKDERTRQELIGEAQSYDQMAEATQSLVRLAAVVTLRPGLASACRAEICQVAIFLCNSAPSLGCVGICGQDCSFLGLLRTCKIQVFVVCGHKRPFPQTRNARIENWFHCANQAAFETKNGQSKIWPQRRGYSLRVKPKRTQSGTSHSWRLEGPRASVFGTRTDV